MSCPRCRCGCAPLWRRWIAALGRLVRRPVHVPAPTVSAELAHKLELTERIETMRTAERVRSDQLYAVLLRCSQEIERKLASRDDELTADRRSPDVIAAWLECAS